MRRLKGIRWSVAFGVWGVFVFHFAATAALGDAGSSANAPRDFVSDAVLTFVAEPGALVGDANGGVGWRFGDSGDSGDSGGAEQDGRNVATAARGNAVYSPEKRAVELDGARFELPTPQEVKSATAWTLVAVAEVREPLSIGVLASRDAAVPLVQLDVDENDRFRFIVRDVKGATVAACVPAPYRKPVFVAAVFETLDGKSRVRLTVGKETVESDATSLTFPVWGEKIQIGGLDFPGASFSWRGAISEVALLNGAASQAEVERLRDTLTQKYALDLSPTSAPKAPDSWDVLATPRFDGTPDRELKADVCVVGAGSAGCAAAISAARAGANVVLIERQKRLGGTGTNAFVSNWEGGPGDEIARELFDRMKADGGAGVAKEYPHQIQAPTGFKMVDDAEPYENSLVRANPPEGGYRSVAFLPNAFDKAVREMLAETGRVEILDETTFFQAEKSADGTRVESVLARTLNGSVVRVKADVFVDSTGDVFLCRAVGCETFIGVDPKSRFGEIGAPDDATLEAANGSSPNGPSGGTTGGAETLRLNAIARCYLVEPRDKPKREIVAPSDRTSFPQCAYVSGW
ncbi:MAG: FAD-dependent oxidoreductase, partial [Thermoguttaceae bacterium]|nr:FAD-dependent oxidoreductase [Thermoguttaceae bacterium]